MLLSMPILRISKARKNLGCVWEPAALRVLMAAAPSGSKCRSIQSLLR